MRRIESGDAPLPASDDMTLVGFATTLRRHRVLLGLCLLLSLVLVGAYTTLSTPVFEASSVLRFESEQVNLPQLVRQLSTENRISTEIAVLQRRSAAVAVIDSLGLRAEVRTPRPSGVTGLFSHLRDRLSTQHPPRVSDVFSLLRIRPGSDTTTLTLRVEPEGRFTAQRAGSSQGTVSGRIGDTVRLGSVTLALRPEAPQVGELEVRVIPLEQAVRRFASSLKVSRPTRDADLIGVTIRGSDPVLAADAANLLAEQLITGRQGVQLARTSSTVRFLKQQLDTLGIQLRLAEDQLQAYRERAGVVAVEEQARTQVGRLAQIQADRGAVEAERRALAMLLQQMRSDSARGVSTGEAPSRRLMSFPTLFRNQAASELLGALARVENERSALLTRRTAQDPDVQVLSTRIRELDAQVQEIAETYLQGLTNQVVSLEEVARRFGGALDSLPEKEVRTARLERDVRVQQELYTLIQTRLKESQITQAMEDPSVRVVDPAVPPDQPVGPRRMINFALAVVLGLLLGVGIALYRELSDQSVRSRADALQASGLPILGAIPRVRRARRLPKVVSSGRSGIISPFGNGNGSTKRSVTAGTRRAAASIASRLVTLPDTPAGYVESFSQLYANLALTYKEHPVKILVFTSPLPGEGKTLSIVNFALTLAGRGFRLLLVDGDLRCGLLSEVFDCPEKPGFAELLSGTASFEDAVREVPVGDSGSLVILPSGTLLPKPGRLLVIERVREVLEALAPQFDLVLIDSPPVNLVADAALLGSAADAVLLVVRAGHTRVEALTYAMDQLGAARAPVIGTLLNDIDARRHGGDDGSYHYLTEVERYYARRN
jgi:polysaccharide biosynthesis transport protein